MRGNLCNLMFVFVSLALSGCSATSSSVDRQAREAHGQSFGGFAQNSRGSVVTENFRYDWATFGYQGTGPLTASVEAPTGYSYQIPIVEVRNYNVGDKDYAYVLQVGPTVGRLDGYTAFAPDVSYGTPNQVLGRFGVLSFKSQTPATWQIVRTGNGEVRRLPKNVFGLGSYASLVSLMTMYTGTDDDVESDYAFAGDTHFFKTFNGNSRAYTHFQLVEFAYGGGIKVRSQNFDVRSGESLSYTLARDPALKAVVLATPNSYITNGADQVSWNVECSETTSSATCTVSVTGGNRDSRVHGTMMLIESP